METITFNEKEYKVDSLTEAAQSLVRDILAVRAMKDTKLSEAQAFAVLEARMTADLESAIEGAEEAAEVVQ